MRSIIAEIGIAGAVILIVTHLLLGAGGLRPTVEWLVIALIFASLAALGSIATGAERRTALVSAAWVMTGHGVLGLVLRTLPAGITKAQRAHFPIFWVGCVMLLLCVAVAALLSTSTAMWRRQLQPARTR